ncbi:MAG: FAD-dependent oxidoreductase [Tissierellaceae bacterium]
MALDLSISFAGKDKNKLDKDTIYDILIIGGGPAGLNAALYSKRKGHNIGIITKNVGGQVIDTSLVENYLGYSSISGENLMKQFENHVKELGLPILEGPSVKSLRLAEDSITKEIVLDDDSVYRAKSVIIATGSKPKKLAVQGEDQFAGNGVAYCAICDGPLFAGLDIVVAGGGNSAIEAAIDLAKIASKVTVVHRSQLRADKILVDRINQLDNVEIKLNTQILRVLGDRSVNAIEVLDKSKENEYRIETRGVFVEIGYLPTNEPFKNLLKLNEKEEIQVDKYGETSVKGIFAAGDTTDTPYKQIIISAADGAKCALSANEYLNKL